MVYTNEYNVTPQKQGAVAHRAREIFVEFSRSCSLNDYVFVNFSWSFDGTRIPCAPLLRFRREGDSKFVLPLDVAATPITGIHCGFGGSVSIRSGLRVFLVADVYNAFDHGVLPTRVFVRWIHINEEGDHV